MAKTFAQINDQIEALKAQAETLRVKEVAGVVARIKEAIAAYGLTAQDLGLAGKRGPQPKAATVVKRRGKGKGASKKTRAPQFGDESGNVWSGRGPRPGWIKEALASGKKLEDFAIAK